MGPRAQGGAALLLLLPLLAWTVAEGTVGRSHSRSRRGLLQLAGTIQCATERSPFAYMRYGCYCGFGGTGWPRDKADWCCFKHDCCYGRAESRGCNPKMQTYSWHCKEKAAECDDIEDKCQSMACKCDREAAKCLAKAPYTPKYLFWPDTLCGKNSPICKDD
uniref:Phospholipase A2 n=1 Tax=Salvator merianae TaxID=96440 RepID=A0A8D0B302_SALMN